MPVLKSSAVSRRCNRVNHRQTDLWYAPGQPMPRERSPGKASGVDSKAAFWLFFIIFFWHHILFLYTGVIWQASKVWQNCHGDRRHPHDPSPSGCLWHQKKSKKETQYLCQWLPPLLWARVFSLAIMSLKWRFTTSANHGGGPHPPKSVDGKHCFTQTNPRPVKLLYPPPTPSSVL